MIKLYKRIYNIVTTVLLIISLLFVVMLVGVRLVGLKPYTVLSGSMEPTYHVGSLIYVKNVDPNTLKAGDPITYQTDTKTVVTHRIVEVIPLEDGKGIGFRTKGDANKDADGGDPIPAGNVLGKPVFTIPYMGYAVNYIQSTSGVFLAVGLCLVLLLGMFIPEILEIVLMKPTPTGEEKTEVIPESSEEAQICSEEESEK